MGAEDNRAAAVAAFKGIQQSPRVRHHLRQTHCAHHTHTKDVPPPCPVQRQAISGVWVGPRLTPTPKLNLFTTHGRNMLIANAIQGADIAVMRNDK